MTLQVRSSSAQRSTDLWAVRWHRRRLSVPIANLRRTHCHCLGLGWCLLQLQAKNVLELGVREGVSTLPLLLGASLTGGRCAPTSAYTSDVNVRAVWRSGASLSSCLPTAAAVPKESCGSCTDWRATVYHSIYLQQSKYSGVQYSRVPALLAAVLRCSLRLRGCVT